MILVWKQSYINLFYVTLIQFSNLVPEKTETLKQLE